MFHVQPVQRQTHSYRYAPPSPRSTMKVLEKAVYTPTKSSTAGGAASWSRALSWTLWYVLRQSLVMCWKHGLVLNMTAFISYGNETPVPGTLFNLERSVSCSTAALSLTVPRLFSTTVKCIMHYSNALLPFPGCGRRLILVSNRAVTGLRLHIQTSGQLTGSQDSLAPLQALKEFAETYRSA